MSQAADVPSNQITASEIAQRIGVSLPAVSNWRRRHESFPSPEVAEGKELFALPEIVAWLNRRKIAKKDLKPGELPGSTYGSRLLAAMNITRPSKDAIDPELLKEFLQFRGVEDVMVFADLVLGLLYLAVVNKPRFKPRWDDIMAAEGWPLFEAIERAAMDHVPRLGDLYRACDAIRHDVYSIKRLTEIAKLVDRVRRSGRGVEVFDFLLNRFTGVAGRREASVYTPSPLVDLMVALISPMSGSSIFDPCCGSGEFLIGAAKYISASGAHSTDVSFTGHALSERSAHLTYMNLRLHGVAADLNVRGNEIFLDDRTMSESRRFNVIISNPPFDMKEPIPAGMRRYSRYGPLPRSRSSFAWLQYIVSSLADGGQAAVVMPSGALFRAGSEGGIRAQMVDEGVVEAVIALPSGMFSSTGIPVTVWLLSRSAARPNDEVLLIDASSLGHMISRTQRSLSGDDQSRVVDTLVKWRSGDGYEDVPGFSVSVPVSNIRDQGYILTPGRYVAASISPELSRSLRSPRELRNELVRLERRADELDMVADHQLNRIRPWIL